MGGGGGRRRWRLSSAGDRDSGAPRLRVSTRTLHRRGPLHQPSAGPPPRSGEEFAAAGLHRPLHPPPAAGGPPPPASWGRNGSGGSRLEELGGDRVGALIVDVDGVGA